MELILFLLSVFIISFTGAMMPGPVTAVVLANAKRTPYAGLIVAAGHAVVEIPLILFLAVYAANFMENALVYMIVAFAGAAMLVYLGAGNDSEGGQGSRPEEREQRRLYRRHYYQH
ncbi:MAG: LysE family transporter [Candidatus Marinimicrobia bacterium]|nr:LysE family transporter [Candidatus Neomarinimicrobiota bacterium]